MEEFLCILLIKRQNKENLGFYMKLFRWLLLWKRLEGGLFKEKKGMLWIFSQIIFIRGLDLFVDQNLMWRNACRLIREVVVEFLVIVVVVVVFF
jgi:hypothetical protein